jgi:hypothetical protein
MDKEVLVIDLREAPCFVLACFLKDYEVRHTADMAPFTLAGMG